MKKEYRFRSLRLENEMEDENLSRQAQNDLVKWEREARYKWGLEVVPGASGKPSNLSNHENGNPLKKKKILYRIWSKEKGKA
jgi:hypothetical protein